MGDELDFLKELGREEAGPDEASVSRARALLQRRIDRAGGGGRRPWRPFHLRWSLAVAIALLLGSGFGFVLGTSSTSSVSAASSPVGLGFLPERGWDVLQSGTIATLERPAVSIAANVELSPDDDADGLPLSTLRTLPRNGIVILASFTARGEEPSHDNGFTARALPLNVREAAPFGAQLRPKRPLGQYELRAAVNSHNVHVDIYLGSPGPSPALLAAAQRQLDRLVVAPSPSKHAPKERPQAAVPELALGRSVLAPTTTSRVIDRTLACTPAFGNLDVVASPRGASELLGGPFTSSGYARVTSGSHGEPLSDLVVAARPGFRNPSTRFPAAVYASSRRCVAVRTSVPLTRAGLPGLPTAFSSQADCSVRGRVLVRVRAILNAATAWGRVGSAFVGARGRVVEAELAVRDQRTRRPLAFVRLGRTGKTQFWSSARCV